MTCYPYLRRALPTLNKKVDLKLINALRNLESGPWGDPLPETSHANYFGTVWRREISLPRAHIIIISAAIYIFYLVINVRAVSLSDTGFRKWPGFISSRDCYATVLSEFLFDLLRQGVARNYLIRVSNFAQKQQKKVDIYVGLVGTYTTACTYVCMICYVGSLRDV